MTRRTALPWLVVLAVLAFAAGRLDMQGGPSSPPPVGGTSAGSTDAGRRPSGPPLAVRPGQEVSGVVVRVVDGDTVHVRAAGTEETVRYIGVDTPESVKPDTPVQCFAKAASHRNAELVDGQAVRLVVGEEPRDRYGRLLAYVFRASDARFVNAELVAGGFARTLTIPPNTRYAQRFATLARTAQRAGKGLWRTC